MQPAEKGKKDIEALKGRNLFLNLILFIQPFQGCQITEERQSNHLIVGLLKHKWECFVPRNDERPIVIVRRNDKAIRFTIVSLFKHKWDCFVPRNDEDLVPADRHCEEERRSNPLHNKFDNWLLDCFDKLHKARNDEFN